MTSLDSVLKRRDSTLATKVCNSQSYSFSSSHVRTWELDHNEGWGLTMFELWCSEDSESPLDSKEIKPVNLKGNQPCIFIEIFLFFLSLFIGRTDAVAPILWPLDANNWLIGKDSDAGKDWRQRGRGQEKMRWLDSITDPVDMNLSKLWEIAKGSGAWHAAVHGVAKSGTWLSYWTSTTLSKESHSLLTYLHRVGWGKGAGGRAVQMCPGDNYSPLLD